MSELIAGDITGKIIKSFFDVYNSLGYGFLEKVYENALAFELREIGLHVEQQKPVSVHYKNIVVGDYFADLLVESTVLVELKCADKIVIPHEAQLLNYLRATHLEVGLLLNFGPKPEYKRKIHSQKSDGLLAALFDQ